MRRLLSPTCLSCCHRENHSSLPRSWIRASFECHPHCRGKWTNRSSDRHLSQALGQICLVSSVIQMSHWIKISFFVKWGNWNWSLSLCLALRILDFRFASRYCFLVFCLFFRCTFQSSSYKIDLFGNPSYYLNFRAKWKSHQKTDWKCSLKITGTTDEQFLYTGAHRWKTSLCFLTFQSPKSLPEKKHWQDMASKWLYR